MEKSFSPIVIKTVSEDQRIVEGIATTPTPDRSGDVIEPGGLTFAKEVPLLLNHNHSQPVGTVQFGEATAKGLPFRARIVKVDEDGTVKQRTDEAWHSVKAGLIKGVSIGFIPSEGKPFPNGGTYYAKAEIHELSLASVPCNPDAVITAFKSTQFHYQKDMTMIEPIRMQNKTFIRAAIAKAADGHNAAAYAANRWGEHSTEATYIKAAVNPMAAGADATGVLTAGKLSRSEFVQAVFSRSILGQMQGLVQVPAITRINVEASPVAGAFFGEGAGMPLAQGDIGVYLSDKRKAGVFTVVSQDLIRATDDTAEATLTGILVRALSRAIDNAFVGTQARDEVSPEGLGAVATHATGFSAGVEVFAGDITQACVLVNPLTAISLRSPTENQITARGGFYSGMPAICSYAVSPGKLFITDATRVLAYIGDSVVDALEHADVYGLSGVAPNIPVNMFQTSQVALTAQQYIDWQFVPGAAVEVALSA
ncbi:major capsid protein [Paraburkholderia sp. RP-4-7]|uniref:Major capsid protein n=1 Tax=Paraburkholderia polaris TaxID=2728848 RepID=A0A848IB19_9BURK|nr:major capsid protein [Paraburkholderia polaris]